MAVIEQYECDAGCGFYKNHAEGPCRRIGCDGTVVRVEYVQAGQLRGAVSERDKLADHLARALAYAKVHPHAPQRWIEEAEHDLHTLGGRYDDTSAASPRKEQD